jgi:hypothetical protein
LFAGRRNAGPGARLGALGPGRTGCVSGLVRQPLAGVVGLGKAPAVFFALPDAPVLAPKRFDLSWVKFICPGILQDNLSCHGKLERATSDHDRFAFDRSWYLSEIFAGVLS